MCGIVALISHSRADATLGSVAVEHGLDALARRGPDGRGIYESPTRRAVLGHARLAIVDVEGGAQPIASEDGQRVLVFNGELYGHTELRAELESRGHRFRSRCDAEIALHLYEDFGPAMLERLRGEFAFAIWDERDRVLFAARDRFGVKPLVYAENDGLLHLASQAKALFAMGIPARWDDASFFQAASMQYTLPDETLFAGVRVLPPGCFLLAHDGHLRVRRYWDQDYPNAASADDDDARAFDDAAKRVHDELAEAVRVRLVADVPIAFQLSGGIDSSAVLGLAAQMMGSRPADTFTVAFEDELYDEQDIAAEMARSVGANLHVVRASAETLLRELPAAVIDGEGLAINGHIAAKRMLARAVHDAGFKVVLTGEGSDEVFAGYAHLRADLDGDARVSNDNAVSAGLMLPHGDALDLSSVERVLGWAPTWLRAKAGLGHRVRGLLRGDFVDEQRERDPYALALASFDVANQLRGRGPVEQALYLWSKLALEGYILRTLGDGMEMAFSVEGRLPFLDHRLFELVRTLPTTMKIRDGVEKAVLRKAIGPLVTERLRTRQKHPFLAPPLLANAKKLPAFASDLLRGSTLAPFFDAAKIEALVDRLPSMTAAERTATEPALMFALTATILHGHYRL